MFGSPETTPGGRALKFYSSVRLDIRRIESIKDGAEVVGNRTRVKVVKNKVAPPFQQAEFDIMYGKGISREGSLLDVGVDLGIVKKSGAWFTYEGEQLGQGRENAKTFLTENPEIMVEITEKIRKIAGRHRRGRRDRRSPPTTTPRSRSTSTADRARLSVGEHDRWARPGMAGRSSSLIRAVGPIGALERPRTLAAVTAPLLRPHLRVPDERARLRAHRRAARGRRHGGRPTTSSDADVVVLNTCCIRENADNKLYGHLGHLKALKDARPDLQIAVGGCLAQKDRERSCERAPHVDVVFGTHNVPRAPSCSSRARVEGPVVEILEEHEAYPSALPARRDVDHAAWVTIQIGCDNSCAFCIVPVGARARDQPPHRRHRRTRSRSSPPTASSRSRCSARTSTPTAATSAPGSTGPLFADLLRAVDAVDGIQRVRFTSPHPKDLRPETIAAMAECASVCEHLHLPLQSGSDRTLAAHAPRLHRRALPRAARRGPRRHRRPRGHHRHHRRLPRRDRRRLRAHARGGRRGRATTPPTRSSSRPGPAPRRPTMADDFVAPDVVAGAHATGSRWWSSGTRWRSTRRASAGVEEVLVEGPSKNDAAMWSGRTRQNKLVHFAPERRQPRRRRPRRRARHRAPRRTGCAASCVDGHARTAPGAAPASRSSLRLRDRVAHLALVGPTASGSRRSRSRVAARARRRRDRLGRLDAGVPGHRHRHRQADRRRAGRGRRTTWSTSPTREEWSVARFQQAAARRARRHRGAGQAGAARRRHRALRAGGRRRRSTFPAEDRAVRDAILEAATATATGSRDAYAELDALDPGGRRAHRARQPPPDRARARGDRAHRSAVLVVRPRHRRRSARPSFPVRMVGRVAAARRARRAGSPTASTAMRDAGPRRRGPRARATHGALSRTAAPGHRLPGAARPPRRRRMPSLDDAFDGRRRPHPAVRPPPAHVVPPRSRASSWFGGAGESVLGAAARLLAQLDAHERPSGCRKLHATGNDFLVRSWLDDARRSAAIARRRRARSATATAASAPTGSSSSTPGTDGADCR